MKKVIIPLTIDFDKSQIIGRVDLNKEIAKQLTDKDLFFPKGTKRGKTFKIQQFSLRRKLLKDIPLDIDTTEGMLQLLNYIFQLNINADYGPGKIDMLDIEIRLRLPATNGGYKLLKLLKEIVTKNNGSIQEQITDKKNNSAYDLDSDIRPVQFT